MSSLFFILLCCFGALIVKLWLYTDFFAFYIKILKPLFPKRAYSWLLVDEFLTSDGNHSSYIEYLFIKRYMFCGTVTQFFLKLLSCQTCFSTWIAILISIIYGNLLFVGLAFILLRIFDFLMRYTDNKII